MSIYLDKLSDIKEFFDGKKTIVIVQGDNPDADSLSSSLALDDMLYQIGVEAVMFCSIDVPEHLRYLEGWDRVTNTLPTNFDGWILLDCAYIKLLDNLQKSGYLSILLNKPLMVIDHHDSPTDIDFAKAFINDIDSAATGEVLYNIADTLGWDVSDKAAEMMAVSILADTLGFNSEVMNGRPRPLYIMAKLVEKGVNLSALNERRLARMKITPEIFRYKAELMHRVQFHFDNTIATIDIPHDEIKEFSMDYNPTVILDETRNIEGLAVAIGFKSYERNDNVFRITGRIRCNHGYQIARDLAQAFGDGGGHIYAAGFKIEGNNLDLQDIKNQVVRKAHELLAPGENDSREL